jgi:Amt family ammonium transporter
MSYNSTELMNPPWLDTGNNAWQLTAASLVALQSVPGLVVLYSGIVKRKWALNSAFMAFYAFAAVLICWVLWAYKAGFGEQMLPFVGVPGPVVAMHTELQQSTLPAIPLSQNFPLSTMGELFYFIPSDNCNGVQSTFSLSSLLSLSSSPPAPSSAG